MDRTEEELNKLFQRMDELQDTSLRDELLAKGVRNWSYEEVLQRLEKFKTEKNATPQNRPDSKEEA